ncbi:MAG: hypothetical protein N5P05_001066 [Chroococcopsis gigantea SAG 12.99]|jgi:hypothetical protein|nr:hypothetical protein [Chlorogloea purpurea SAG 13.99]MDV2999460.1 hypothetical protein [Chroococcopsis gigantea SAG 12.99]
MAKTYNPRAVRVRIRSTFETVMALIVLLNFILVVFDLTYIPLRNFWLQGRVKITLIRLDRPVQIGSRQFESLAIPPGEAWQVPFVTVFSKYDRVKAIQPHRETMAYLGEVDELESHLSQMATTTGMANFEQRQRVEAILKDLRERSDRMIDTNPFQLANKTGTLERIKNLMRSRVFGSVNVSARESFRKFWSLPYLEEKGYEGELAFFNTRIRPLMETNYFRPIGENGEFVNNFNAIDFLFFLIFLPEFLLRTWWIGRSRADLNWPEAMLWRWYDIFLLIPFARFLRVIPTAIRLNKVGLLDLNAVQRQSTQGLVAAIAEDITEVVIVRVINQLQGVIRGGEIRNLLSGDGKSQFVDLNNINEIAEIAKLIIQVTVQKVLPKVKPDAEFFIQYSIKRAMAATPGYEALYKLPGMERMQQEMSQRMARQMYQTFSEIANGLIAEDSEFDNLLYKLVTNFQISFSTELQSGHSIDRLEALIVAFLEELKVSFSKNISDEDMEIILEQSRQLQLKNKPVLPPYTYE